AGWHLDLHVDDLDAAVARATGLGAALTNAVDGLRVLATPGGQPFCFIGEQPARGGRRPAPPRFPGGRSLADQFCFDLPAGEFDAEVERHISLGAEVVRSTEGWTTLRDPAGLVYCVTCRSTGVRITAAVGTPDRI